MYNDKVIIRIQEVVPPITDYIIPVDFCQKNELVINFTTDNIRSKFELF